jgi:integrase/recombinase XerD
MRSALALPQPILAAGYATLIGLLASTGMRVGEALNLDDTDIDGSRGVIVVRGAKFNKTREVPIDATTLTALFAFIRRRNRLRIHRRSPSLFVSTTGARIRYTNFGNTFRRLLRVVGVQQQPSPRIHDLRHTFAVNTLCDWYRSGVDVDPRMPLLSTYLGHVSPTTTYWYLKATPQLVALAAKRLEQAWEQRS